MAKTYTPPKVTYTISGNHIETDGKYRSKVSGTSMAGILKCSPWSTPFQVACALLGLGREDISGKPAVTVGTILERPIIRYADKTWGEKYGIFNTAEEVFQKREGDHDAWESDFEDDTFAGHVDGIVMGTDGNEYILEIKTTSNLESWADGVPEYYQLQIALYNRFITKQDKAYVVLGMVNEYTYRDPLSWVPGANNVSMFEMKIDQAEFEKKLETVKQWYEEFIINGRTPDYDPNNAGDVELYEHLVNLARDESDLRKDLDRLTEVEETITKYEDAKADLYLEREVLKNSVKTYLSVHKLSQFETTDGSYVATLKDQNRAKLDEAAMMADGIDVAKYKKTNIVKTFSIKKKKE